MILSVFKRAFLPIILLLLSTPSFAQMRLIKTVVDCKSLHPLPFCNVAIQGSSKGTMTNADGVFILTANENDSIAFSYVGYKKQSFAAADLYQQDMICLTPSDIVLDEIVISPDDNFLYDIVNNCRKNLITQSKVNRSKVYYSATTFVNDDAVEFLDCYFNGSVYGSYTYDLFLKNGRFTLHDMDHGEGLFMSFNLSHLFSMINIPNTAENMPVFILQMAKKEAKKNYVLSLETVDPQTYKINFSPIINSSFLFSGSIWIDKNNFVLKKLSLTINDTSFHPFRPFGPGNISNVSMEITQTYNVVNKGPKLALTTIHYSCDRTLYRQDMDNYSDTLNYNMKSDLLLYNFDYNNLFILPYFDYDVDLNDYMKMSIIPYNEVFWSNPPLPLTDKQKRDVADINNTGILSIDNFNKSFDTDGYGDNFIFSDSLKYGRGGNSSGLFETPYFFWSKNERLILDNYRVLADIQKFDTSTKEEVRPESVNGGGNEEHKGKAFSAEEDRFLFYAQILLDVNYINDSLYCKSYTVLDAAESYWHLVPDSTSNVFINILFDLCEIERIKMQKQLSERNYSPQEIEKIYYRTKTRMNKTLKEYIEKTRKGEDLSELEKYNSYIRDTLGIDNIKLFNNSPN